MTKVRLEIDEVQIHRPRKRWNLYFVVVAEHPVENDKMIVATLPAEQPFKLSARHNNVFQFDTNETGSEGLFVLSRELPESRELNVHIYLRHTRQGVRNMGEILSNLKSGLGADAFDIITSIVGTATLPWLVIAKKAIPLIGKILVKIPDRDFGFLSAFERFGNEFEDQHDIDRKKDFSGDASLVYSWSVDES